MLEFGQITSALIDLYKTEFEIVQLFDLIVMQMIVIKLKHSFKLHSMMIESNIPLFELDIKYCKSVKSRFSLHHVFQRII